MASHSQSIVLLSIDVVMGQSRIHCMLNSWSLKWSGDVWTLPSITRSFPFRRCKEKEDEGHRHSGRIPGKRRLRDGPRVRMGHGLLSGNALKRLGPKKQAHQNLFGSDLFGDMFWCLTSKNRRHMLTV